MGTSTQRLAMPSPEIHELTTVARVEPCTPIIISIRLATLVAVLYFSKWLLITLVPPKGAGAPLHEYSNRNPSDTGYVGHFQQNSHAIELLVSLDL